MNRQRLDRKRVFQWMGILIVLVGSIFVVRTWFPQSSTPAVRASVVGLPTQASSADFAHVTGPRALVFPKDHGPHPEFQTEWWYYTGNLRSTDGRRFGFQLTFFRRAAAPIADLPNRTSEWAASQIYMAHFTLTDAANQKFHSFERFERGSVGLAGAVGDPSFKVWLDDWSVQQIDDNAVHLQAREEKIAIDLRLEDQKGVVLQGDRGYSQKGPQPGNASIYYSQTRLKSQGTVTVDGESITVSGLSWLDREISTSSLSKGQVGWDWFSLQLDDGSELMAYVLRRSDGTINSFSNGTLIAPDGETKRLKREDFSIVSEATWKSPHSGGKYPARWRVRVPSINLDLQVEPLVPDQELNHSFTYWEGAVQVRGNYAGRAVEGNGYVELTGYAKSMEGQL